MSYKFLKIQQIGLSQMSDHIKELKASLCNFLHGAESFFKS